MYIYIYINIYIYIYIFNKIHVVCCFCVWGGGGREFFFSGTCGGFSAWAWEHVARLRLGHLAAPHGPPALSLAQVDPKAGYPNGCPRKAKMWWSVWSPPLNPPPPKKKKYPQKSKNTRTLLPLFRRLCSSLGAGRTCHISSPTEGCPSGVGPFQRFMNSPESLVQISHPKGCTVCFWVAKGQLSEAAQDVRQAESLLWTYAPRLENLNSCAVELLRAGGGGGGIYFRLLKNMS